MGTGQRFRTTEEVALGAGRYLYRVKTPWFLGAEAAFGNYSVEGETDLQNKVLDKLGLAGRRAGAPSGRQRAGGLAYRRRRRLRDATYPRPVRTRSTDDGSGTAVPPVPLSGMKNTVTSCSFVSTLRYAATGPTSEGAKLTAIVMDSPGGITPGSRSTSTYANGPGPEGQSAPSRFVTQAT